MAPAVGDIIQITDVQTHLGSQVLNVYFYRITTLDVLTDYADIAEGFDNVVRQEVLDVQSIAVNHPRILVKNLTNGIDIHEQVDSVNGTENATETLASFFALGFRLVRTNATTRHGSKRIAGIPEGYVSGHALAGAGVANAANLAVALAADIARTGTVDHDFTAEPVIIGRFPTGHAQAGELNLAVVNPVQSAQFIRVTTQTTRRLGRGS